MRVLILNTYDLGRQPFGVASAAAWLRRDGFAVDVQDLAVERLDDAAVRRAAVVALHVPMHTATRLALEAVTRVRAANPTAPEFIRRAQFASHELAREEAGGSRLFVVATLIRYGAWT